MRILITGLSGTMKRLGEVWKFQADISKADELLDFQPEVEIEEGLGMTAECYQDFCYAR